MFCVDRRVPSGRALLALALAPLMAAAAPGARAAEPVATFSIVGCDQAAGELGIAVQSKFFAVGAVVPWARAGVGAIATQAFANTTYGPAGLDLLANGIPPEDALRSLLAPDSLREQRQVGIVDARGRTAAHTGSECIAWAGHMSGDGFTAQGNILVGEATVQAMARAFQETPGMLGEKLMRALEEGQKAGGDSRGMQSAAILIVREGAGYGGYNDRYCDLRVDDHAEPIGELRRIFDLWQWNALILEGYTLCDRREWSNAFDAGARLIALKPNEGESYYHPACYYSKAGDRERALENLARAVGLDPSLKARAREDPDFKPLKQDAEFARLLAE
jgi:uncharacterized Ntn-hydrolase superfamily protein